MAGHGFLRGRLRVFGVYRRIGKDPRKAKTERTTKVKLHYEKSK